MKIKNKNAVASNVFEATVVDVDWNVSKLGALKPIVSIDGVDTGNCCVERAIAYNAGFVLLNKVAKGAKCIVRKNGIESPKIISVSFPANEEEVCKLRKRVSSCPCCGGEVAWSASHIDLICRNKKCNGRALSEAIFFYKTTRREKIGDYLVSRVFNGGFDSIKDMLNITFAELLTIEGIGEGFANMFIRNNARIRKGVDIVTLMQASNCFPNIGRKKIEEFVGKLSNVSLFVLSEGMLSFPNREEMKERPWYANLKYDEKLICDNMRRFYDFVLENRLTIQPAGCAKPKISEAYKGMVVFLGKNVVDRFLEEEIVGGGGTIIGHISKYTTHAVVRSCKSDEAIRIMDKHPSVKVVEPYMIRGLQYTC